MPSKESSKIRAAVRDLGLQVVKCHKESSDEKKVYWLISVKAYPYHDPEKLRIYAELMLTAYMSATIHVTMGDVIQIGGQSIWGLSIMVEPYNGEVVTDALRWLIGN